MDTINSTGFLNLPGVPDVLPEDLAGFGLGARLGQHRVVAERELPLLIRALRVHRRGVAGEARRILGQVAGRDLGSAPGPWQEWWQSHLTPGRELISCGDPHCALAC